MKLLYIHHGSVLGGAPVSLLNMVQGLKQIDPTLEIKIACINRDMATYFSSHADVDVDIVGELAVSIGKVLIGWASIIRPRSFIQFMTALVRLPLTVGRQIKLISTEKPDIVHLNSATLFACALASKLAGVPCVWHVREVIQDGLIGVRKRFSGWVIRRLSTKVIAISPYDAESLGPDSDDKVQVIYNFVDTEHFRSERYDVMEQRKKLGIRDGFAMVLSLGGVSFRKGAAELLEAAQSEPDARVVYVFAGPIPIDRPVPRIALLKHKLEDKLIHLGIKKYRLWAYNERILNLLKDLPTARVLFVGPIVDVAPLIAAADVVAFCGTTPHFPRPVYEAWCMKKPVVVFEMDGVSQNVEHDIDGICVYPRVGAELAGAIKCLLEKPADMTRLGSNGHRKAIERFSRDRNVRRIYSLYQEIVGRKAA